VENRAAGEVGLGLVVDGQLDEDCDGIVNCQSGVFTFGRVFAVIGLNLGGWRTKTATLNSMCEFEHE
jgi:hypothetical protein